MTALRPILCRLGLEQYLEILVEEGFDSWETVLDITESDLDTLGVKLGHRRKLQREIANFRVYHAERLLTSPTRSLEDGLGCGPDDKAFLANHDGTSHSNNGGKRKYKRHPKPDENAPERPPSAYVIFSNKIRELLKPQNLTFTEIAKRVGESWQVLAAEEKEPYETKALTAKQCYHAEMAKYKGTDMYKVYSRYLVEFKAKNASNSDGKKPRLEKEESVASSGSTGSQADFTETLPTPSTVGRRNDYLISRRPHSLGNEHPSPNSAAVAMAPPTLFAGHVATARSGSSGPPSPLLTNRRESAASPAIQHSPPAHHSSENIYDRSFDSAHSPSLPRIVPLESRDSQFMLSKNQVLMNEHQASLGRYTPPRQSRHPSRPAFALPPHSMSTSSKSSGSSSFSNIGTPATSVHTPATPIEDRKLQRLLPPISTVSLQVKAGSPYADPDGQPNYKPFSNQISSYALPPPLHSPFLSSSAQGIVADLSVENRLILPDPNPESPERDQRAQSMKGETSSESFPSPPVDGLSVLAYAGRMVDRGSLNTHITR